MITAVSSKSDNSAEDKQRVDKLNNAVAVKVGSLKLFGGQLRKVAAITHNEQSICGGHNAVAVTSPARIPLAGSYCATRTVFAVIPVKLPLQPMKS